MTRTLAVLMLACLAATPALAADEAERSAPPPRWQALDTDGDGALSLAEVEAGAPRLARRFAGLDADGDGRLTPGELQAAGEARREQARQRADERWTRADANGDGYLDLAEAQIAMPRVAADFARIDADGNGLVSREELRSAMRERHAARHGERKQRGGDGRHPPRSVNRP